jgi:hypothetical protein
MAKSSPAGRLPGTTFQYRGLSSTSALLPATLGRQLTLVLSG